MFIKSSLFLIFILPLNSVSLIQAANVYNAVFSSFEKDGTKVFCVLMLTSENQAFTSNDVPVIAVNISDVKVDLKKSPCKNYVIAIRNLEDIKRLDKRQLRVKINSIKNFWVFTSFHS